MSADTALTYLDKEIKLKGIENALNDIDAMERTYYLAQHPFEIYYSTADKRYRTYLPPTGENPKRKPITSVDRTKLENKIIEFYKKLESCHDKLETLERLYPHFLEFKIKETSLANAHKLDWLWNLYYQDSTIVKRKITDITVAELKEWLLDTTQKHQLTNRKFKDMKSLINMLFDYAIDSGITSYNTARNIHNISYKKFVPQKKKTASEQVFIDNEEEKLIQLALSQYEKTCNTAYLGVCLNFALALRVGELVAIELTDISDIYIHIHQQEVKHYEKNAEGKIIRSGYDLVPYVKTPESDRTIYLTRNARCILDMIQKANQKRGFTSNYLMLTKDGQRMHNDAINNVLRRLNQKLGTSQKGNHSIRKTCLSNMSASGLLTDEEIRSFAGHKDIATTQNNYIFATNTPATRAESYEKAINARMPDVFKSVQLQKAK